MNTLSKVQMAIWTHGAIYWGGGGRNVACRFFKMAKSPVAIVEMFLSIYKDCASNVACRIQE